MVYRIQFQRICSVRSQKLLSFIAFIAIFVVFSQLSSFQYGLGLGLAFNESEKFMQFKRTENQTPEEGQENGFDFELAAEHSKLEDATEGIFSDGSANSTQVKAAAGFASQRPSTRGSESVAEALIHEKDLEIQYADRSNELLQMGSEIDGKSVLNKGERGRTSISDMKILLHSTSPSASLRRPLWFSARDKELQNARHQIENAPIIRNTPIVLASLFRNYSRFMRSYELMEKMLKVYVYKEGQKPIFHQPHLKGIYASEGWFMKLMKGNMNFIARDPRKAHLFYLPFSSLQLRRRQKQFASRNDFENHVKHYVDSVARKYRFWNRTGGADHFLVACHDWAPQFTRHNLGSCIRALCNSNIARGFNIGKDISLPVTYIDTPENPIKDLGGNHHSERPILAFFAGSMHGNLRPILLQHWKNKEADMKIFGPMPRDNEVEMRYREYMKSTKYCICARGYEVHTPRVVESIYYECVPVIISDNYVPPFFEIFEWESFSVFILEKDVPNLRNILLSIPEEKYIAMHKRLKMVQQHFVWHKNPVKYDLFHMILYSVWCNRVFQVNSHEQLAL